MPMQLCSGGSEKISLRRMGSSVKEFAIKAIKGPQGERLLAAA